MVEDLSEVNAGGLEVDRAKPGRDAIVFGLHSALLSFVMDTTNGFVVYVARLSEQQRPVDCEK